MTEAGGAQRINRAPNLLVILLWHHFCYYKRHRILLAITLLMPFILITIPYILVYVISSTSPSDVFEPCQHQTVSPMSVGPYHYSSMHDCRNKYSRPGTCSNSDYRCDLPSFTCVNQSVYVEASLNDQKPFCPLTFQNATPRNRIDSSRCACSTLVDRGGELAYDRCSWLRGRVVYYPNTSQIVQSVMADVISQINAYGRVLKIIGNTSEREFQTQQANWPGADLLDLAHNADCFEEAEARVTGFGTRQEMLQYIKWLNDTLIQPFYHFNHSTTRDESRRDEPPAILWAALNFEGTSDDAKTFRYFLLMSEDSPGNSKVEEKAATIQDILETAIVKIKLNVTRKPVASMWKELPSKCWTHPKTIIYSLLIFFLPIGCVIGFVFAPINFLGQVITEKQLKLREYLSIMGVSDLVLKLSWILFYMTFLIPASILAAVYIHQMYAGVMIRSHLMILITQFVLFNLALLLLSYFVSSFAREPRKVTFVYVFLTLLPSIVAVIAYYSSGQQLRGTFLVVVRILSLHCAVPFVLSLCYVIQWERLWIGAQWQNFLYAPSLTDEYGGFGEGIIWMLADCLLYLLLAWYFQNVKPGEYGLQRKPCFFLQPSYWMPKRFGRSLSDYSFDAGQVKPDLELREIDERDCVLIVDRLTKFYNRDQLGVDRLSMKVYKHEIVTLLGQNGAGKSTTMNTLVGLLTPTSGRFTVAGLDCTNQMQEIKKLIGFVPQHDILYPSMTVEEHLQFFGWLKGMSKKEIQTVVCPLLDKFGMSEMKKMVTTKLSGGQKRKLSVLTAFIGGPELVVLDEPTTGVDPFSRRSIWDLLLHRRATTAIILSTHFMDEADVLSDRIAVISEGTLRCVGSPMYLKDKYGHGFRIIAACKSENGAVEKTKAFFAKHDSEVELRQASGLDLTFTVPQEYARSRQMIDLLESVEDQRDEIGISSFGVSEPTLEEAFFSAAELDVEVKRKMESERNGESLERSLSKSSDLTYSNRKGIRLWLHQFLAVVIKRVIQTVRAPGAVAMQIWLPMTFIIILLLATNAIKQSQSSAPTPVQMYSRYSTNVLFFQNKLSEPSAKAQALLQALVQHGLGPRCPSGFAGFQCEKASTSDVRLDTQHIELSTNRTYCSDCTAYCSEGNARQVRHWKTPSTDLVYQLPYSMNAMDWVLVANQSDHWVTGGFQFHSFNYSFGDGQLGQELQDSTPDSYVVVWTKPEKRAAMLNAFNNLLLRTYSSDKSASIEAYVDYIRFPRLRDDSEDKGWSRMNPVDMGSVMLGCQLLIFAFIFATFSIAVTIQQEKASNLRELQYVSGVKPSAYWLANFVWDFVLYMFTLATLMVLLTIFPNVFRPHLNVYMNILVPFGMSAIGFIYLISLRFKSSTGVNQAIVVCGLLSIQFSSVLAMSDIPAVTGLTLQAFAWLEPLNHILRLVPYHFLTDACIFTGLLQLAEPRDNGERRQWDYYDMNLLGKRILEGYIVAVFWMAVLIAIEHSPNTLLRLPCRKGQQLDSAPAAGRRSSDPDVQEEERRVLDNGSLDEPVVVKGVSKRYPKASVFAVDSVQYSKTPMLRSAGREWRR